MSQTNINVFIILYCKVYIYIYIYIYVCKITDIIFIQLYFITQNMVNYIIHTHTHTLFFFFYYILFIHLNNKLNTLPDTLNI